MKQSNYYNNLELAILVGNCVTQHELKLVHNMLNYLIRHGERINNELAGRLINIKRLKIG